MKKPERNDPCPCGSGKKFKKCCELKMFRGRFLAAKVDAESAPQIRKSAGLTSLFHSSAAQIATKPLQETPPQTTEPSPQA